MDKSDLCHVGNRIEVSRHRIAKLNKMKYYKYKDLIKREVVDDNIKMEIPDEIATERAKIILRRRLRLKFVLCEPKKFGAG